MRDKNQRIVTRVAKLLGHKFEFRVQATMFMSFVKVQQTTHVVTNMAGLGTTLLAIPKLMFKAPELVGFGFQQVRNKWVDARMIRDVKRRNLVKEHAVERLRINSLRKNNILPLELREIADQEIAAFPRDSCWVRIRNRCVITSRARSVIPRWRISRIMFRELADYNKLSGVQRAMW